MIADLVLDNSALIEVFAVKTPRSDLRRRVSTARLGAPELISAEALRALRRLERKGAISAAHANRTLRRILEAPINKAPHRPLATRAWELRHSISAYDALYVALAERLGVPLVTCDAKLAGSDGHNAVIELYSTS